MNAQCFRLQCYCLTGLFQAYYSLGLHHHFINKNTPRYNTEAIGTSIHHLVVLFIGELLHH